MLRRVEVALVNQHAVFIHETSKRLGISVVLEVELDELIIELIPFILCTLAIISWSQTLAQLSKVCERYTWKSLFPTHLTQLIEIPALIKELIGENLPLFQSVLLIVPHLLLELLVRDVWTLNWRLGRGVHDHRYLILDKVAILKDLLPDSKALARVRQSLAPNVNCCLQVNKSSPHSVALSFFDHVATTFAAFHDQLVKHKIFVVYVIYVFWKLLVPFVTCKCSYLLEYFIESLRVLAFNAKENEVKAMLDLVTLFQNCFVLRQLTPLLCIPEILNHHLHIRNVHILRKSSGDVVILIPFSQHFQALQE